MPRLPRTIAAAAGSPAFALNSLLLAAGKLSSLVILAKGIAFLKDLVVARYLGVSAALDAYLIALILPAALINILGNSLTLALIPHYSTERARHGDKGAHDFASRSLTTFSLFFGLVALLVLAAGVTGQGALFVDASFPGTREVSLYLAILAPFVLLSGITSLGTGFLQCEKQFLLPSYAGLLSSLVAVLVATLAVPAYGGMALALGTILGGTAEAVLVLVGLARSNIRIKWSHWLSKGEVRDISHPYAAMMGSSIFMATTVFVDQYMATWLGSGAVSVLNYAIKLPSLGVLVLSAGLSQVFFPTFADLVARSDYEELKRLLVRVVKVALALSAVAATTLILLSPSIIRLLFQRGAFTAESTVLVSFAQQMFALQVPWYVTGLLFLRLLAALHMQYSATIIAAVSMVLNVFFNFVLMKWIGVAGIALSTSLVYFVSALAMAAITYRTLTARIKAPAAL